MGVVEKCNFCAELLRQDKDAKPFCVEASEGAFTFGYLSDPHVSELLRDNHTICRRFGLGTGPNVFYIV